MTLASLIEKEEGRERSVYQDTFGYWTIGVGHLVDARRGGKLPDHIIDLLLEHDINEKTAEVERALPWVKDLDEARRAVLIAMAFQMGTDGLLGFRNTLSLIERGTYTTAAENMLLSKWAQQTPNRARRMAEQMRTGQWQ